MDLGPLTTTFIPPASCASSAGLYYVHGTVNPELYHILLGPVFEETPECLPPLFAPDHEAYYAPGVCPGTMVSVCESVTTSGASEATVTVCCPEWDDGSPVCASSDAEFMCHFAIDGPVIMSPITEIIDGVTYITEYVAPFEATVTVHAHGVKVMAQQPDVSSVDDSTAPTSTEDLDSIDAVVESTLPSLPSETASPTNTPATDNDNSDDDDNDDEGEGNGQDNQREDDEREPEEHDDSAGLTSGQLAGVVVGSVFGSFLLLYLLLRKPCVVYQYHTTEHRGWFSWNWSSQK